MGRRCRVGVCVDDMMRGDGGSGVCEGGKVGRRREGGRQSLVVAVWGGWGGEIMIYDPTIGF